MTSSTFIFGLSKKGDDYDISIMRKNIRDEVIAMKMRSWLQWFERKYFRDFSSQMEG